MDQLESQAPDGFVTSLNDEDVREGQRRRRYGVLAKRQLPDWAPEPIVRYFRDSLFHLHVARIRSRSPDIFDVPLADDPARETHSLAHKQQCEADLAIVKRLCTYVEMESLWKTIATTPVVYPNPLRRPRDGDDTVGLALSMIMHLTTRFGRLAKRTPAARKKSLIGVGNAIRVLIDSMESDSEAAAVSRTMLSDYFGSRNIEMRRGFDEAPSYFESCFPRAALVPYDEYRIEALDETKVPAWRLWSGADKYIWLNDEVQNSTLSAVLQAYYVEIERMSKEQSPIAQPGRADGGLQPFLIREVSDLMNTLFGKPFDDKVALIVSAIMDLPIPLTRDGIRPYKKSRGKISVGK